ncbi:MAG: hypothetical protein D3910_11080 [Candidatus Electrothrix sp. ATG2]|nr:hypothetical protein [Candidatus Electrothrix sp. ATG2]
MTFFLADKKLVYQQQGQTCWETAALAKLLNKGYYAAKVSDAVIRHPYNHSIILIYKVEFNIRVLHEP